MLNTKVGISGKFKIEARQPDGSIKVLVDWFDNLITDYGLDKLGKNTNTNDIIQYCRIGTGTTAPTNADTSLVSQSASTNGRSVATKTAEPSAPYFITHTWTYTFTQGAVVGNMSEIGIGATSSGADLWSRARIKDGGGSDTTITVAAIDQLIVSYAVKFSMNTSDIVTTPTINGVSTTVTIRPFDVTSAGWFDEPSAGYNILSEVGLAFPNYIRIYVSTGTLVAITSSSISGSYIGNNQTTSYNNGDKYKNVKTIIPIDIFNQTSTLFQTFGPCGKWQIHFSPGVTKINTQTLTFEIRIAWDRV